MATQESLTIISAIAGADLSAVANVYKFVEGNQNSATLCNADTDIAMGILQGPNVQGAPVPVATHGISKLRVSGPIAAEARIAPDTDGRGKTAAAGDQVRAIAMEAATGANDLIAVRLVDSFALLA